MLDSRLCHAIEGYSRICQIHEYARKYVAELLAIKGHMSWTWLVHAIQFYPMFISKPKNQGWIFIVMKIHETQVQSHKTMEFHYKLLCCVNQLPTWHMSFKQYQWACSLLNVTEHCLLPSDVLNINEPAEVFETTRKVIQVMHLKDKKQVKKIFTLKCGNFHIELRNFQYCGRI